MLDFIGGLLTGITVTLTGHPIDTIKVRMQAGEVRSLKSCVMKTYRADGFKGFYYGISSPLYSIPVVNAVVFSAYAQGNALFDIESAFWKGILAGSYAGLVNTIVVTPVELIKIKMQIQSTDSSLGQGVKYSSSWDCVKKTFQEEGVKGYFKGGMITIYREIPGYAAQFASFEWTKALFRWYYEVEELGMMPVFVAGMVGGFNCWTWSYPQDVIKTIIQSGHPVKKGWDGGARFVFKEIWIKEGFLGFWRGYSACIFRSTVPNGFGFLVNDLVMNYANENNEN